MKYRRSTTTVLTPPAGPPAWNGWGPPDHRPPAGEQLLRWLDAEIGPLRPTPSVAFERIELEPSALTPEDQRRLAAIVGAPWVRVDRTSRIGHLGGRSYVDLMRLRRGEVADAPDAVVSPADGDQVARLLQACAAAEIAVVPFGGGTSVVGGVAPLRGRFAAVVALEVTRLDRLVSLDDEAHIATFEPGIRGARAEALLRARGYTLGHFPQSYAYASLGGYVATRSAGQASAGYGRIDDLVIGARCATPIGELRVGHGGRTAAGPDLRSLLVGSEGSFGILTELDLQVRPAPPFEHHAAWAVPSFASGAATVRALAQAGVAPDIVRLSDVDETRVALATAGRSGRALRRYLEVRGLEQPALLVLGWEGTRRSIDRRRAAARQVLGRRRTIALGRAPGEAWADHRFDGPHQRDDLLDRGVMVDTLETATSWGQLGTLYLAVRTAIGRTLARRGTSPLVLCHISHVYRTGASLYFTWLARRESGDEVAQWDAVKRAASEAVVAAGGTITHHHGVGLDHRAWMREEVGDVGLDVLRAVKDRLDPTGILNPGKLLPPP